MWGWTMGKVCLHLSQLAGPEVFKLLVEDPMFLIILRSLGSTCTVLCMRAGRAGGHLLLPKKCASQNAAGSIESCTHIQNDIFQPHVVEKEAVLLSACRGQAEILVC